MHADKTAHADDGQYYNEQPSNKDTGGIPGHIAGKDQQPGDAAQYLESAEDEHTMADQFDIQETNTDQGAE